jgi:hypothetical protein
VEASEPVLSEDRKLFDRIRLPRGNSLSAHVIISHRMGGSASGILRGRFSGLASGAIP